MARNQCKRGGRKPPGRRRPVRRLPGDAGQRLESRMCRGRRFGQLGNSAVFSVPFTFLLVPSAHVFLFFLPKFP